MSDNRLPIDDPRLTAYALGELDPAEAAEIEAQLDGSPGSRGAVDEIRELAGLLTGELRQEQPPGLRPEQRAAILQAAAGEFPNGVPEPAATDVTTKSPLSQAVGGGSPNGRWGRRFASVMTVAAMIMVAVMLLPSQRPGGAGRTDEYVAKDFDGDGFGGGGGGMGLAHTWNLPAGGAATGFRQFGDGLESSIDSGRTADLEDEVRMLADAPVDGSRPMSRTADDFADRPDDKPGSALMSRSYREQSGAKNRQGRNAREARDHFAAPPLSGPAPVSASAPVLNESGATVADRRNEAVISNDSIPGELKAKSSGAAESKESLEKGESNSGRRRLGMLEKRTKSPAAEQPMGRESDSRKVEADNQRVLNHRLTARNGKPSDSLELESAKQGAGGLGGYGNSKDGNSKSNALRQAASAAGSGSAGGKIAPDSKKETEYRYVENGRGERTKWKEEKTVVKGRIVDAESKPDSSERTPALAKKMAAPAGQPSAGDKSLSELGQIVGEADEAPVRESGRKGQQKSGEQKDVASRTENLYAKPRGAVEALGESDAPVASDESVADTKSIDNLSADRQSLESVRRKGDADKLRGGEDSFGIVAGLTRKVTVNFDAVPLQEVVKKVAEQGEFRYDLDAEGLIQQGISPQTRVTLNVESVPAEVALKQVLTPLALSYAVNGQVVRITNRAEFAEAERAPGTEEYDPIVENAFVAPMSSPLSTFSIDVDTASYANVRRFITQHQLPPRNAVRIEELVNYFAYDYPQPDEKRPVSVNVDVGQAPWRPEHRLVRIGLKAREIPRDRRPASNFVFLVDVSGSMSSENKLPLVKRGLTLLTEQMTEGDRVAIVTYSDTATVRLDSTTGDNRKPILDTINSLQAAGSTNGAGGIQLAYRTAIEHFVNGGTNRVILCTDGDFNVGVSSDDELVQLIQDRARSKVFFSVFGFGMGNLKDGKLEKLADKGNGHYAYIDGQREAQKVFVDELSSTLVTVAKDVKLQVEFNPARVGAYRLIGYENRALATQDFHDDRKDAGEMGAGHSVTALYEIAPADRFPPAPAGETLRYQRVGLAQAGEVGKELMSVRVRYKLPEGDESSLFEVPVIDPLPQPNVDGFDKKDENAPSAPRPPRDFDWAAAVAAYGMVLRDSQYRGQAGLDMVLELAQGARGDDPTGRRQEFIDLVQQTKSIRPSLATTGALYLGVQAPAALTPQQAEERATVNGKYRNLLRIIPADSDATSYGAFRDFGRWEGTSYLGHDNLPRGYWVYVAPNWYIWGDAQADEKIKN